MKEKIGGVNILPISLLGSVFLLLLCKGGTASHPSAVYNAAELDGTIENDTTVNDCEPF